MADAYYYSSAAQRMQLAGSINGSTTTAIVDTVTGLPASTPFKLVIDPGLSTEEIVKVTNVSGTTLTIVRGWDSTAGQAHGNLAEVRHMVSAEDLRLSREHEAASSGVHGAAGAVVGTTDTQVLTNKDLTSGTNTFPASLATDTEVANAVTAHAAATQTHGASGALVGTSNTQTLTNKNLTSPSNTFPATLALDADLDAHTAATAAHGATGAVVGTTNTQTLTNKTISGASNTLTNIPQSAVTSLTTDLAALDTRLDTLEADTGNLSSGFTVATGWTLNQQTVRKVGPLVQVYLRLTRSGANITGNSTGDIVNVSLGDMAAAYIPSMPTSGGGGNASGIHFACGIWTDGGVFLSATPPNVTINTGESISMSFTYLV